MPKNPESCLEFSRALPPERLGRNAIVEEITATAPERAALVRRFGLLGLDRFAATLRIGAADGDGLIRVEGHLSADATQACVVTLEPTASRVEEDFSLLFSQKADPDVVEAGEVVVEPEGEGPPEPLGGAGIDLGEIAAQQLALALDSYPRAPGAALAEPVEEGTEPEPAAEGAFAVLRKML